MKPVLFESSIPGVEFRIERSALSDSLCKWSIIACGSIYFDFEILVALGIDTFGRKAFGIGIGHWHFWKKGIGHWHWALTLLEERHWALAFCVSNDSKYRSTKCCITQQKIFFLNKCNFCFLNTLLGN